ncbi:GNAT family N-acetyltransferase [Catenovulum sediminis]|uniref:GNAT family N-acetyltransferase n=1 Tax=Catenovulum sediminis TaxID=1740262 RepID=A0ABV1RE62_9ALTE
MKLASQKNIQNMVSLWQRYGARKQGAFWYSNSWPNRVWHDALAENQTIAQAHNLQLDRPQKLVVYPVQSCTGLSSSLGCKAGLNSALTLGFQLQLMNLNLTGRQFPHCDKTELTSISPNDDKLIHAFSKLCSLGFGYTIDTGVLQKVVQDNDVKLVFLSVANRQVATALLHCTGDTLGVYQLAVPEQYRGRGYAKSIMLHILHYAQRNEFEFVSLQASEMGLGIYQKLGFSISGRIDVYQQL